jgi:hypothetical protein
MPIIEVKEVCNIALAGAGRDGEEEQVKIVYKLVRAKNMNQFLS